MVKDMTGQEIERLKVLHRVDNDSRGNARWKCICKCGNECTVLGDHLRRKLVRSCGCLQNESRTKHGMRYTRPYSIWKSMKERCYNPNHMNYHQYGGRGIIVCPTWKHSFSSFWEDMQQGYADHLTIDRIDTNGNYEPSNCKWSTMEEQSNNTRANVLIEINGEKKTIPAWCREYEISFSTVHLRIYRGWNIIEAITTPVKRSAV